MDGNGRWATARGLPRIAGHREGARAVRRTVEASPDLGIGTLTLYAFSSDNWQRPTAEVSALMDLLERFLIRERRELEEKGVKLEVIGRRDRLHPRIVREIERTEEATASGSTLRLRVAVDYSARWAISAAAHALSNGGELDPVAFAASLQRAQHSSVETPDVDLLIRTSGEKRLSDFLLWESAYAELYFTPTLWPDFGAEALTRALAEYRRRDRRFGRIEKVAILAS
jgi:undecaprenyl diphosphate synthase